MEGLAPTLHLCMELRIAISSGESVLSSLRHILPRLEIDLRREVQQSLFIYERRGDFDFSIIKGTSAFRISLFQLILCGLRGEPVLERLRELEDEISIASEEEIEGFIAQLPFKVMMPLLLIQFPAFLILMFGPILSEFTKEILK